MQNLASNNPHPFHPYGQHWLIDFYGVEPLLINQPDTVQAIVYEALLDGGVQILHQHFHHFGEGQGVTGFFLLAESHCSIHTWPEHRFAAMDVFTCGKTNIQLIFNTLEARLQPQTYHLQQTQRGRQAVV